MIPLARLLDRFKGLSNTDKAQKEEIVAVLREYNLPAQTKQIILSRKKIILKLSPIAKTEALLKKEEILAKIQNRLGKNTYNDLQ